MAQRQDQRELGRKEGRKEDRRTDTEIEGYSSVSSPRFRKVSLRVPREIVK